MSLVVLGLDGATWRNLGPWIDEGRFPNLAELIGSGTSGTLQSTIPCTTVPAIPAMTTGMNPGNLGLFGFTRPDGTIIDAHTIDYPAIWDVISEEHTSLVANLRTTYPPYELNGTMISGDLFLPAEADDYVYPRSMNEEVAGFHDTDEIRRWNRLAEAPEDNETELLSMARGMTERKYATFKRLWKRDSPSFGVFWIGKTDAIQHHFWHKQDVIRRFYDTVDDIIGDLASDVDPDNIAVVSDHGFGQVPERQFHVNTWLHDRGHLSIQGGTVGRLAMGGGQELLTRTVPKRVLRRMYDGVARAAGAKSLANRDSAGEDDRPGHDESDTGDGVDAVLSHDFEAIPGIDFASSDANLDRPWGIRVSGGNCETIDAIINALTGIRDDQGDQVVQSAWHREEVFSGKYLDQLPEIVFLTTDKYRAVPQLSWNTFTPRGESRKIEGQPVTGEHNAMRDGIVVLDGPAFESNADDPTLEITDVAPTIVHLFGGAVPESMDGGVRTDILSTDREVEYQPGFRVSRDEGTDRSDSEETEIRSRLRNLGYLDE